MHNNSKRYVGPEGPLEVRRGPSILRGILEKTSSSNDRTLCFHPTSRPNNTGHECFYLQFTDKYSFRGPVSTDPPPIILYSLQDQFCGWCNNPAVILIAHPVSPLVYIFPGDVISHVTIPSILFFETVKRCSIKRFHFNLLFERNESTSMHQYGSTIEIVLYVIRAFVRILSKFLSRFLVPSKQDRNKNSRLNKSIYEIELDACIL